FYHYRQFDATELAREATFEDVWHLLAHGALPTDGEREAWRAEIAAARALPPELDTIVHAAAPPPVPPPAQLRTVQPAAAGGVGLRPLLDLVDAERRAQARRVAAVVPTVLARLHRAAAGLGPVPGDPADGHVAAYLRAVTGRSPEPAHVRALEQYLVLTIDHGFNASTFT